MLTDKNDNMFLNALNDIDDDLVEEIAEAPVEPEIISAAPKKSSFIRFAAPAAATLAVMAVLGIGALIIMQNLPSLLPGGGTTLSEETAPTEETTQVTTVGSEYETTPTEISEPDHTLYEYPGADEILGQEIWQDINHYPKIDVNNEESILRIPNYSINPEDAKYQSGLFTGALFDIKKCGDYDVALLGFNVWKDTDNLGENTVLASELRIALVKNDKIISALPVYEPLESADHSVFTLMLDRLNDYTEAADFGQNEYIIIFRSLKLNEPVPKAMFFFVDDKGMRECKRAGSESDAIVNYHSLSASISIDIWQEQENDPLRVFRITDNLTGDGYGFDICDDFEEISYYTGKDHYAWGMDKFMKFDPDSIPVIDEFTYDEVKEIVGKLTPQTIINEKTVGDYTLTLMGEHMWKNSEGVIYVYNTQTIITKNGEYIGSVNTTLPEMYKYRASMMYSNTGSYDHYGVNGYMFGDTLLIIDHGLLGASYFGSGCFYACNDSTDYVHSLAGYWPGMSIDEPPAWTEGKQGQELTVDTENQTVIYGFQKYTFDLSVIPAMYNYTVSWIEEPLE